LLTERLRELLCQHPAQDVGGAAGRERDDHPYRLGRIGRLRDRGPEPDVTRRESRQGKRPDRDAYRLACTHENLLFRCDASKS
jgi:hypothetical protein